MPVRTLRPRPLENARTELPGFDLQLSGHPHGGRLWPGSLLAELANPTVAGPERYGDTRLYVSRGAGVWGPPVRVGAPSDIAVVQLASMQAWFLAAMRRSAAGALSGREGYCRYPARHALPTRRAR